MNPRPLIAAVVVCVAIGTVGCTEPTTFDVPNSADAARACLDLIRAERDDPDLELDDPNRTRLDSSTLVYFAVVDGEYLRPFACRFRFDVDAQTYTAESATEEDRLDARIYPPESDAWDRLPPTPGT